jgi:hypothetical protein
MYRKMQNILLSASFLIIMIAGNVNSEELETGLIVESVPDAGLIQVHDHMFKVGEILVVTKENERSGEISELKEGLLVEIVVGEKKKDYWIADTVKLYLGELATETAKKMELAYSPQSDKIDKSPVTKAIDTPVVLENGVWKN